MLGLQGLCATIFATLSSRAQGEVEQAREVRGMSYPVDVMPKEKLRAPPKHGGGKKQLLRTPFWDAMHDDKTRRARTHT